MVNEQPIATTPSLSVVIPVFNDWDNLDHCLAALARQTNAPNFEVIVVDDGSDFPIPGQLLNWSDSYPLTIVRQPHTGISSARNTGVRIAKAPVFVFVDADCRAQANCLAALEAAINKSLALSSFQLRLVGDCSTLSGRTEELRLATLQEHFVQREGSIRYLNTAGFAIRRTNVDIERGLFDPAVLRGEDTLLLVQLIQSGQAPLFVPDAVVEHTVPQALTKSLRKCFRSAYLEAGTYEIIAASGFKIRISHPERIQLLQSMWKASSDCSIRRLPWFILVFSQALQRLISVGHSWLTRPAWMRRSPQPIL